jgi:diguanylate cyclase (GGDEF)-like protein
LIIDDTPANLQTLGRALAREYDLYIAHSGAMGLRLVQEVGPDVILLDVMMPEMDGYETLRQLRQLPNGDSLPVIFLTADDRVETQVKCLTLGADDFIAKPVVLPVVLTRLRNVIVRQALEQELRRLATTDGLTGVFNRRHFFALAEAERARVVRYSGVVRYSASCSVLMLDIDHFKAVNDHHGHAAGDAVLKAFAETIAGLLRSSDTFGRLGGEEFAVLLPHTDRDGALNLAERLRLAVAGIRVAVEAGREVAVTTSIGVTRMTMDDRCFDEALRRADAALYAAKAGGRNRVREAECGETDP